MKFSRIELYLPLSNDAIFCQWHYYMPHFKFWASPPPQLGEIWDMLTISNYYHLPLPTIWPWPTSYLPPLPPPSSPPSLQLGSWDYVGKTFHRGGLVSQWKNSFSAREKFLSERIRLLRVTGKISSVFIQNCCYYFSSLPFVK